MEMERLDRESDPVEREKESIVDPDSSRVGLEEEALDNDNCMLPRLTVDCPKACVPDVKRIVPLPYI